MSHSETSCLLGPVPIWVLDPDSSAGPQWRRCHFTLSTDETRFWLSITVRRRKDGAPVHELFRSFAFRGCIDTIFEHIIRGVFHRELICKHGINSEVRPGWVIHNMSSSYHDDGSASPTISFQLKNEIPGLLTFLPQHRRIALLTSAQRVAADQDRRRSAF